MKSSNLTLRRLIAQVFSRADEAYDDGGRESQPIQSRKVREAPPQSKLSECPDDSQSSLATTEGAAVTSAKPEERLDLNLNHQSEMASDRDAKVDLLQLRAEIHEAAVQAVDPTPIGAIRQRPGEGGHDTQYQCRAAEDYLASIGLFGNDRLNALQALTAENSGNSRQDGLILNNLLCLSYLALGQVAPALRAAEAGFSSWHMDIYNHKLIITCKSKLDALGGQSEESISEYLSDVYCERTFEFLATTDIDKLYLCSTNYLTAPAADLLSPDIDLSEPVSAAASAWNSPAARFIRRSIVAGDFRYCSALTCPRIVARDLPKRAKDAVDQGCGIGPHIIQTAYHGYKIVYFDSRVYAFPGAADVTFAPQLADETLVSFTLEDLELQIAELRSMPVEPIRRDWFAENDLESSIVLGLPINGDQSRIQEKMKFSPKNIVLSHDNSCNISCPTCRTRTIIASKTLNAKHDRLIPLVLGLIKDAEHIVCSGSGDPFASRHFRRLISAIGGKEIDNFPLVERRPDFRINLMTNGLQFTRHTYRQLGLRGLVGDIALSMDACEKESFELIRRGSKWDELVEALEFLGTIRHENKYMKMVSYFTVQRDNFRHMEDFVEFCRKYRFDSIQLNMPQNWGSLTPSQFEAIDVGSPANPHHIEFLDILSSDTFADPYVALGNAADLRRLALGRVNLAVLQ